MEDKPTEPTLEGIKEFLQIEDAKKQFKIVIGSCTCNLETICNYALQVHQLWDEKPKEEAKTNGREYVG